MNTISEPTHFRESPRSLIVLILVANKKTYFSAVLANHSLVKLSNILCADKTVTKQFLNYMNMKEKFGFMVNVITRGIWKVLSMAS